MAWLTKVLNFRDETYLHPIIGGFALCEMTVAFLIIGVPAVPRVFSALFSHGTAMRCLFKRIKLLGWNRVKRPANGPDDGYGRTGSQTPSRNELHRNPREAWEGDYNDTFDLLSVSTVHVEAERFPAYDVNSPQGV